MKPVAKIIVSSFFLALLGPCFDLAARAEPQRDEPRTPAHAIQPVCDFSFKDSKLSANAQNCPLSSVADFFSGKAGLPVLISPNAADQTVSVNFSGLSLDESVKRFFKQQDAFFFYGVRQREPAALQVVWVYSKGEGQGLAPVPPEQWASSKDLSKLLSDRNPQVRASAILTVVERGGEHSAPQVRQALKDNDGTVRAHALFAALRSGVKLPPEDLRNLATSDQSADVRFLALQSLDEHDPQLRDIARGALNDSSPVVRSQAKQILSRLEPIAEPPQPSDANRPQE
jgi:hypothetical protein